MKCGLCKHKETEMVVAVHQTKIECFLNKFMFLLFYAYTDILENKET